MRSEEEMFHIILKTAEENNLIRAVYMNGSRANPNIEKDLFQDYDIVYVVTAIESFIKDSSWLSVFGEIAMVQEPDINSLNPENILWDFSYYGFLILFKDSTRIDLHIETIDHMRESYGSDSLTVPLMDKDGILPHIPKSSEKDYLVKRPEEASYNGCCNNFFWCLNNVAKGIVRDQLPYAMRMYYEVVLGELHKMMDWYISVDTGSSVNVGMWGKQYKKYLPPYLYELYKKTYSGGNYDNLWEAIFTACDLFRISALHVGEALGYCYNKSWDENIMDYLKSMRNIYYKDLQQFA
ncbi:aminoglycoside 6-adenylyltransferase [Anaeropeptidivorans aminofermentans]|uniref:aminoglycoside 6-adenylyltransferase n=1 Tax=Anaeropeptidivorans aminofermentans TaxID=2934315 RepID=UPI000ED8ED13|nr:aminoglycoside 6-adenylyltransferase [Anaeropeptidivorans aminofermentans]MBE6012723.1 aminoglycoside 6-adenylyltransferase [Lachnospiraceae bacterium]HAQ40247.1 aminoglycoside adenylyltransferase [Clostridiales bacterium]